MKRIINLFVETLALPFSERFASHDPVLSCAKRAGVGDVGRSGRSCVAAFDRCLDGAAIEVADHLNQLTDVPSLEALQDMLRYVFRGKDIVGCAGRHRELRDPADIVCRYHLERLMELTGLLLTTRNGYAVLRPWNTLPWDELFVPRETYARDASGMGAGFSPLRVELWNSLLRCLPEDLLLSCYAATRAKEERRTGDLRQVMLEMLLSFGDTVQLSDVLLDQVLERGMAETHLHAGASRTFGIIWEAMGENAIRGEAVLKRAGYHLPYKEPIQRDALRKCVLDAVVARALLAGCLRSGRQTLALFMQDDPLSGRYALTFRQAIEDIRRDGLPGRPFCDRYHDGERFWRPGLWRTEEGRDLDIWRLTGLPDDMRDVHPGLAERFFMACAFAHVTSHPEDRRFTALLMYYLRKRNTAYRMRVQDGKSVGLAYFQRFYALSTDEGPVPSSDNMRSLIFTAARDPRIRKAELRFAPRASREGMLSDAVMDVEVRTAKDLESFIREHLLSLVLRHSVAAVDQPSSAPSITQQFQGRWHLALGAIAGGSRGELARLLESFGIDPNRAEAQRLGIVYHMIKRGERAERRTCFADRGQTDRERYGRLSFGTARYDYDVAVRAISNLRNRCPAIGRMIVGIDAASLEIPTEPWVFAPAFREARERNGRWGSGERDGDRKPLLGLTYHVGEDFRHPLSGLRHIDEAVTGLGMRSGDRIGHGLALGIDLDRWRRRNGMVLMPRLEWMENNLWLWHLIATDYRFAGVAKYGKLIERQILDDARAIYGTLNGITVESLYRAYATKTMPTPEILRMAEGLERECESRADCFRQLDDARFFPCWRESRERDAAAWREDLLAMSHHCEFFLRRMREVILVAVTPDQMEICEVLQRCLREKVSRIGIVVETNPSSNTVIGEMDGVLSHPVWSMRQSDDYTVMATINTDDPSVFNATVANEHALAYYAFRHHGLGVEEALCQVDAMRRTALDTSFIRGEASFGRLLEDYESVLRNVLQDCRV